MIYEIKNDSIAVKCTTAGGTITSIKDKNGLEYLWQGDPDFWKGQAPVLFPICGTLRNNTAKIGDGMRANMPRHGVARHCEFTLTEKSDSKLVFKIESSPETLQSYPYSFIFSTIYKIIDSKLYITYKVTNTDNKSMPFFVGAHPAFNCPLYNDETFDDYYIEFEKEETCDVPKIDMNTGLIDINNREPLMNGEKILNLRHNLFYKDALIMHNILSRKVSLLSKKTGKGLDFEFPDFPVLQIWSSANDGPFVALEPWMGIATCSDEDDVFEHKRFVQFAEPCESKEYTHIINLRY